ncbi:PIG-L deacetylase family protein [Duganella sp. CF458]|uniref:PIG-L deacetylase family protein n=1 Tax=Duganella sp. CF458 TaxID=1884368 RepID=UPI000B80F593|nr:PIG-L family deacetylase [Duganella sp. CF458]
MRTDSGSPLALFLFPHQDDEFGVFYQIEQERRAGRRVFCIFVTDGSTTADPLRRNAESHAVLQRLGVAPDAILFVGQELGIADGLLHTRVEDLAEWLNAFIASHPEIVSCYVPAWEGGHPDHDLLHAITLHVPAMRGRLDIIRQFSLYQGEGYRGPMFRVLSPLPGNGPVERQAVGWVDRLRYLRLCLAYPSQWRSWVGLFPFVCLHYLFDGAQQLQRVDGQRLAAQPHAGPLYYERRAFLDWSTLRAAIDRLQAALGTNRD